MATKNIVPNSDGEGKLGTSSKSWAEGHIDSITGTIATAAQGSITSLGILTSLTVDDVIVNGTTIGHTSDTDALKIEADGVVISTQGIEFEGTALATGQSGISSSGNGGEIRIYTNGNQAFTFGADGSGGDLTIADGDLVIGTAGHGITFSSTNTPAQSSGTGSHNTLDDYEEGTWDPVYVGTGGNQNLDNGYYRKVGSLCFVSCSVNVNIAKSSTTSKVSGLPFTSLNSANLVGAVVFFEASTNFTGSNIPLGTISTNTNEVALQRSSGTNMNPANNWIDNVTGSFNFAATYITA